MKGIRLYLIVLGLLIALSVYFLLSQREGSYDPQKIEFSVEDTEKIEWVQISKQGASVQLSRTGGQWTVNGAVAREEAIRSLSILVSRIEVEAPVSRAIEERILAGFKEESAEVKIGMSDGRDKNYLVYYDSITGSSFMMLTGSNEAFRVRVRGYPKTDLEALFVSNPAYWMDNIIFHFVPEQISAISLVNKIEPESSFHLAKNDAGEFEIARGTIPGSWSIPERESLVQYLGYFSEIRFESFRDPASESVYMREEPDYIISLEETTGEKHSLELYPFYHTMDGGEKEVDFNHLFGRIGSMDEWIVIKYVQVDPLLQDFEYFK